MKRIFSLVAILVLFHVLLNSCSKEGPEGPAGQQGTPGTPLTGSLIGFIYTYDEFGVNLDNEKTGVKVTVLDLTPEVSALTNNLGRYQIDNLKTGTYDISFSKTGFATYTSKSLVFVGGIAPRSLNASVYQNTATVLSNFTLAAEASGYRITGTLTPAGTIDKPRSIRLFYGNTNQVSTTNYISSSRILITAGTFSSLYGYDKTKYPTGTSMYMVAVPESYSYSYIFNLTTGLNNYLNLGPNPTTVKSIVIP
jgi:hypothetical protein